MSDKPCGRCGTTARYRGGHCIACHKKGKRVRYLANKEEHVMKAALWKKENPDKWDETKERSRLKKYGLTLEDHQFLFEKQNGKCAICTEEFGRRVHIDHDHESGKIRGLLCHRCNVGLGHFRDREDLLSSAIRYLQTHETGFKVPKHTPAYKKHDQRHKVTDEMEARIRLLRSKGSTLGQIANEVGLSRSWVQVVLKRSEGRRPSITT